MQQTTALAANQCWIGLLVVIGVQNIQESTGILKHDTSFAVYFISGCDRCTACATEIRV